MKKILLSIAVSFTCLSATQAQSVVIAGWDFQTTTSGGTAAAASPNSPTVYTANVGTGTLYLDGSNGSSTWISASSNTELSGFGGTSAVNANRPDGTPAGFSSSTSGASSLALVSGNQGGANSANGKSIVFKVNTTGYAHVGIWYATQRSGATAFTSQAWEYSTDGTTWTAYSTNTSIPTSYVQIKLPSTTGPANTTTAYFRATFSGATATSANNRLDNIQILGNADAPLPLNLLSFNATRKNGAINATWTTADERQVRQMLLERSVNGEKFDAVATVAAVNTSGEHQYQATDASPLSGRSYYRIAIVDYDGSAAYSKTITVNEKNGLTADVTVVVTPNPVANSFEVTHAVAGKAARIHITGVDGRLIVSRTVAEGTTATSFSDLNLPVGAYIASFENDGVKAAAHFVK